MLLLEWSLIRIPMGKLNSDVLNSFKGCGIDHNVLIILSNSTLLIINFIVYTQNKTWSHDHNRIAFEFRLK